MKEKKCSSCGYTMVVDSFTKKLYCPNCGGKETDPDKFADPDIEEINDTLLSEVYGDDIPKETLEEEVVVEEPVDVDALCEDAKTLTLEGKYEEALKVLTSLRDRGRLDSKVLLLTIFCGYRVNNSEDLLTKVSVGTMSMKTFITGPDLKRLAQTLKVEKNLYIVHLLEYCSICLAGSGKTVKKLRTKAPSRKDEENKRPSVFEQMDREEEEALERSRRKNISNSPTDGYIQGYAGVSPDQIGYIDNLEYYESETGLPSVIDLLISGDGSASAMASTIGQKIMSVIPQEEVNVYVRVDDNAFGDMDVKQEEPQAEEGNAVTEDLDARKDELLGIIRKEENRILS